MGIPVADLRERILTTPSVDRIRREVDTSGYLMPEHKRVMLALIDSHEAASAAITEAERELTATRLALAETDRQLEYEKGRQYNDYRNLVHESEEMAARLRQLEGVVEKADALASCVTAMPDAGLVAGDPRYDWWNGPLLKVRVAYSGARAALSDQHEGKREEE